MLIACSSLNLVVNIRWLVSDDLGQFVAINADSVA